MADFTEALPKLIRAEGGYQLTNNKHDLGGWTFAGITRRSHPSWDGWLHGLAMEQGRVTPELKRLVAELYKTEYWDRMYGDQIDSQEVAESLLFWVVLSPMHTVIRTVQRLVGVDVDGIMGPATCQAINCYIRKRQPDIEFPNEENFLNELFIKKSDRRVEVSKRRGQINNLRGWLKRARKNTRLW